MFKGELLALGCAITWSISVVLFKKSSTTIHPFHLNLFKNLIGFILFLPTTWMIEGTDWPDVSHPQFLILAVSGIVGIGCADALALLAIKMLGAARFALIECIYAPAVVLISYLYLGEVLTLWQFIGGCIVLLAVLWVNVPIEKLDRSSEVGIRLGTIIGVISLITMAFGIVLAKPLFGQLPMMWLITVRLGFGSVASFMATLFISDRWNAWRSLFYGSELQNVAVAGFFNTYLSMMMLISSYKYADTAVAATLIQTGTIFTILFAAAFLKEQVSKRQVIGTVLALLGVVVVSRG